eukprot:2154506-Rhodomonas_salina.1
MSAKSALASNSIWRLRQRRSPLSSPFCDHMCVCTLVKIIKDRASGKGSAFLTDPLTKPSRSVEAL